MTNKPHIWTLEEFEFIRDNVNNMSLDDLVFEFNKCFNTDLRKSQIKGFIYRHRCNDLDKCYFIEQKRHYYTDEQRKFLSEEASGTLIADLVIKFNDRFKTELSKKQVSQYIHYLGLKTGVGVSSFNKGRIPKNAYKVGSTRVNTNGYIEVKISQKNSQGKDRANWKLKHFVLWEEHNEIDVPKDCIVVFADGDNRNFDIENLILLTRVQYATMLRNGLIFKNADLMKSAKLIADLKIKIKTLVK